MSEEERKPIPADESNEQTIQIPADSEKRKEIEFLEEMKLMGKLAAILEARNIEEFIDLRKRPWKLIFWNFTIGLFRGIGFLLGATVVGAIIIAIGGNFVKDMVHSLGGLPWIGEKLAHAFIYVKEIAEQNMIGGGK